MQEERRKISFRDKFIISKFRFWIGLLVSLLLSFSIYIFSVSLRDYLRLLTFTQNYNYLEFTANQLLFYNLFYAFLALIIGQTFFFKIVFDTNKKILEKKIQFKRKKIVHDQNMLLWIFLYWFFKLSIMYGMFNMNSFGLEINHSFSIYEFINFYKEYNYLFILIILVLFLQSWQSMRYFSRNYFKNIFIAFVFISVLAFSFSQINIIPFEAKFSEIKKNNVYIKYNIELSKSNMYENLYHNSITKQLYITKESEIYDLKNKVSGIKNIILCPEDRGYYKIHYKEYLQLNIDEKTPIEFLYKIKKKIYTFTDYEITYSCYPEKLEFSKSYYQDNCVGIYEGSSYLIKNDSILDNYLKYKNRINLKQNDKNEILIENKVFKRSILVEYIKEKILENENYIITIDLKKKALFKDYIQLLSIAREGYFRACEIKAKREELDDYYLYSNIESIIGFHVIDVNAPSYDHMTNILEMHEALNENEK
ncbi:hypothetical protein ACFO3U_00920 [Flavobacterium ponti]|uniref:Uncharacterized protein n=1 Tax=Flavobacterium ponti TaxID=665133 RepID=A0ABV9NYX6_9FLAO